MKVLFIITILTSDNLFKGTVAWYFRNLIFVMNRSYMNRWFIPRIFFEFAEICVFESCSTEYLHIPRRNFVQGVSNCTQKFLQKGKYVYAAEICPEGFENGYETWPVHDLHNHVKMFRELASPFKKEILSKLFSCRNNTIPCLKNPLPGYQTQQRNF